MKIIKQIIKDNCVYQRIKMTKEECKKYKKKYGFNTKRSKKVRRLIRKNEIPNDLQISKNFYLEVGTDKAIKECLKFNTFALCRVKNGNKTIYFIDKSVMSKSIFLHELKHAEQYELGNWKKETNIKNYKISVGNDTYKVKGSQDELEATRYAIKHTSIDEFRKDVISGFDYLYLITKGVRK